MIEIKANLTTLSDVVAVLLQKGEGVILLSGEVGMGKTTLVKEFVKKYGIKESVTSPTFSIMHQYGEHIYHYDLYNYNVREILELGLLEWLHQAGIHFVEWGEEIVGILKDCGVDFWLVEITSSENQRIYKIFK